jgi:putative endonuclease
MAQLNKPYNSRLGKIGEEAVVNWLSNSGYDVLHRNYKNSRVELDIVAARNKILYCIEVKTRTNQVYGWPEEYISPLKINKMKTAAEMLLDKYPECLEAQLYVFSVHKKSNRIEFFFEELE